MPISLTWTALSLAVPTLTTSRGRSSSSIHRAHMMVRTSIHHLQIDLHRLLQAPPFLTRSQLPHLLLNHENLLNWMYHTPIFRLCPLHRLLEELLEKHTNLLSRLD